MSNNNFNIASQGLAVQNPRILDYLTFRKLGIVLCLMTILTYACKSDHVNVPKDNDLIGRWSVFYSEMNGKQNDLMEEAHFNFLAGNRVESNIFEGQTYDYSVKEGGLQINNPDQFLLGIDYFQNDTLVLSGKLKYYNLKLKMVKVKLI